ncbi:delta(14)-sterol reductase TM7SF2-like [Dreissena polymorpha]|uniref:Delta(14)-sterol reductase n=1 Tax=Dreissena polymorpha TaxID=45954 RepID=A0A9D4J7W0_DREPO|nr:delta(14)-sterol reductase TM7SF2-like [Dreissena polymorpha]XP_052220701.1 delta(14)-sterol reductase TM7SF2-like [Dreissena polymorpha]KAH3798352.1 hypothetical protein DPMN_151951 [Dreissena polymorpha]
MGSRDKRFASSTPRDLVTSEMKMGGPFGCAAFAILFTAYTFFIALKCQMGAWDLFSIPELPNRALLLDTKVTTCVVVWFLLQCAIYMSPVGGSMETGALLTSGVQHLYRANALFALAINIFVLGTAVVFGYDVTRIAASLIQLVTSSITLCLIASVVLYLRGRRLQPSDRNPNGNKGNIVYDWFMGQELNPRWRNLDFKYVLFRSAIIGWILINICNMVEHYQRYQSLNITLLVLNAVQLYYVADYFYFERGVIVSRDIVHEGLGYNILLQFVMIPFCFCIQTRFVASTNYQQSTWTVLSITLVYVLGFYIYRVSNSEKNDFRKNPHDPKLSHLKTIATKSGKHLLISGWWGTCRHPNYLGDLIISLSYALFTGVTHVLPYLGTVFLMLLLIDRERMDGEDCKRKYGPDWERYCSIVKYRIIPWLY